MSLFPNWETSVVFIAGRIFPGANQTEGWVCLVLWALLSIKTRVGRDCFQCLHIASGAESRPLLPLRWPALFPVRHSKTEKRKIKGKSAYFLKVPTFPDWSPGAATWHSFVDWSDPIQGGNKDCIFWKIQMLSRTERRDGSFRRVPSRDEWRLCTGSCPRGSTIRHWRKHTPSCSFTVDPADDKTFEKFVIRWIKSALTYLQI